MTKRHWFILAVALVVTFAAGNIFYFWWLGKQKGEEEKGDVSWGSPVHVAKGIQVSQVHFTSHGQLLFVGDDAIHMVDENGTNPRVLFRLDGVRRAATHPDGKKVLLDNDFDIFLANIDGTGLQAIANDREVFEFASSFSPDGKKIVFATIDDKRSFYAIGLMDADGSNKRNIFVTKDSVLRHPRWSPDGTRISYFRVTKGRPAIWLMNADGTNQIQLTAQSEVAKQASWSPDGKTLVYSSREAEDFDLWTMDTEGRGKTRIASLKGDEAKAVWSPDGKRIAFICSNCLNAKGSHLYLISKK